MPIECVTCAVVELASIGTATFPRCTADILERGVLTISSIDDEAVIREFPKGTWCSATVYGSDGHLQFSFTAPPIPIRLVVLPERAAS